jgi:hypothetical protein
MVVDLTESSVDSLFHLVGWRTSLDKEKVLLNAHSGIHSHEVMRCKTLIISSWTAESR